RHHVRSVTLSELDLHVRVSEQLQKAPKYGESWQQKLERLRSSSPDGSDSLWKLDGLIAKSNDDLRQEVFVMQLISFYQVRSTSCCSVFACDCAHCCRTIADDQNALRAARAQVWLHTYRILS